MFYLSAPLQAVQICVLGLTFNGILAQILQGQPYDILINGGDMYRDTTFWYPNAYLNHTLLMFPSRVP